MKLEYLIKGILIGIAKIIPGLSGTVLMISFGLYDKAIDAITNFHKNKKTNLIFLINISIGIIIGISLFSNIINYYIYTMSLFIGLIMGSIPFIYNKSKKNIKGYILLIISFIIMVFINNIGGNTNYVIKYNYIDLIKFSLSGILEAIGTIIPGVSSTLLLMMMGTYNIYLSNLSNIFNINNIANNIWFFMPFTLGLLIGIIILSKLIDYLFKNYNNETYSIILGIILSSSILLIKRVISNYNYTINMIESLALLIIGLYIGKKV